MQEKVCRVCQNLKPLTEFYPNKSCKFGVVGTCKICYVPRIKKWYADNRSVRQNAQNNRNQSRKQQAVDYFGNKCKDCEQSYPNYVYQFHHLDPSQKDVNPSYAMSSPTKMWTELAKCVMLCANCHMIRHHRKEAVDETTH